MSDICDDPDPWQEMWTPHRVPDSGSWESLLCGRLCCSTGERPPHTNPCSNHNAHKSHPYLRIAVNQEKMYPGFSLGAWLSSLPS